MPPVDAVARTGQNPVQSAVTAAVCAESSTPKKDSVAHPSPLRRFYSLDVLRGVAALSVVLWHWQHLFLPFNPRGVEFERARQPLFGLLYLFYQHGSTAVQLFFCLSGFIFFWLYSAPVADRSISFRSFSILRLSRLYPLHIVTLTLVAVGQVAHVNRVGRPFVYGFNDAYHFVLNLLFVPAWGLERGPSFNAPIWSVSVEILVYILFLLFCRVLRRHALGMAVGAAAGFALRGINNDIGMGVMGFFIGGLAFVLYDWTVRAGLRRWATVGVPLLTAIAWLVTLAVNHPGSGFLLSATPGWVSRLASSADVLVLFPLTILSLAFIETRRGTLGKRLAFVGDISYSSYLLHFPLQLVAVLVTAAVARGQDLFYSPAFMALFFSVLIALSLASHRYFEVPAQRYLRRELGRRPGPTAR